MSEDFGVYDMDADDLQSFAISKAEDCKAFEAERDRLKAELKTWQDNSWSDSKAVDEIGRLKAELAVRTSQVHALKTALEGYEKSARFALSWDAQVKSEERLISVEQDRDLWKSKYDALSDKHGETVLKFNGASHQYALLKSKAEKLAQSLSDMLGWQSLAPLTIQDQAKAALAEFGEENN